MSECLAPDYVAITSGQLLWAFGVDPDAPPPLAGTRESSATARRESQGALDAFLQIKTATDIKVFAQRFGVLGLCKHRFPASHADSCKPGYLPGAEGIVGWERVHCEPVARWLEFVGAAQATLRLAIAAHDNRTGEEKDWAEVLGCVHSDASADLTQFLTLDVSRRPAHESRTVLSALVYRWLSLGDVRPGVNWDSEQPELELTCSYFAPPTFGVLASQLALAVAGANQIAQCSGCSILYLREGRRTQKGRRNYCPTCKRERVPARDRQRAFRAKHD